MSALSRSEARKKRHRRIRRKISGTAERPRMAVMVTRKRMIVQFVDDDRGETLAAVSSVPGPQGKNVAAARALGEQAARAAMDKGVSGSVFDRGGFRYHGRVKAMKEGAQAAGLIVGADSGPATAQAEAATESDKAKKEKR